MKKVLFLIALVLGLFCFTIKPSLSAPYIDSRAPILNTGGGGNGASNCVWTKVGDPDPADPVLPSSCQQQGTPGSGSTTSCEAGTDMGMADGWQDAILVKIKLCKVQGIEVNSIISANVDKMITAAKVAGLNLTGGGFRTMAEQKALYASNCGNGTRKCSPPTASPGHSNHQMGLAIDINCNGSLIETHSNKCFIWLSSNAAFYGLKNLPSEPWHWSINGR